MIDYSKWSQGELIKRIKWYESRYGVPGDWKNLFRKPNGYEWTILFLLMGIIILGFVYMAETSQCREVLQNLDSICVQRELNTEDSTMKEISNLTLNTTSFNE